MPTLDAQRRAAELQRQLATLTGHNQASVRPYGKHHSSRCAATTTWLTPLHASPSSLATPTHRRFAVIPAAGSHCRAPELSQKPQSWSSLCWHPTLILILKPI